MECVLVKYIERFDHEKSEQQNATCGIAATSASSRPNGSPFKTTTRIGLPPLEKRTSSSTSPSTLALRRAEPGKQIVRVGALALVSGRLKACQTAPQRRTSRTQVDPHERRALREHVGGLGGRRASRVFRIGGMERRGSSRDVVRDMEEEGTSFTMLMMSPPWQVSVACEVSGRISK